MTREELKEHCLYQIEMCKTWAVGKGEEPSGKIYEEHKLILELLEQESILDKIRAEIEQRRQRYDGAMYYIETAREHELSWVLGVIDQHKPESEG